MHSSRRIQARSPGQQHGFLRQLVSCGDPVSERSGANRSSVSMSSTRRWPLAPASASAGTPTPASPPSPLLHLDVELAAGERWSFQPPSDHRRTWLFGYRGEVLLRGVVGIETVGQQQRSAGRI